MYPLKTSENRKEIYPHLNEEVLTNNGVYKPLFHRNILKQFSSFLTFFFKNRE